jgi:hypothetical protein
MAKAKEEQEQEVLTLNPFTPGVSYAEFIISLGDKDIDEELVLLDCSVEQIKWLKGDLEIYKKA